MATNRPARRPSRPTTGPDQPLDVDVEVDVEGSSPATSRVPERRRRWWPEPTHRPWWRVPLYPAAFGAALVVLTWSAAGLDPLLLPRPLLFSIGLATVTSLVFAGILNDPDRGALVSTVLMLVLLTSDDLLAAALGAAGFVVVLEGLVHRGRPSLVAVVATRLLSGVVLILLIAVSREPVPARDLRFSVRGPDAGPTCQSAGGKARFARYLCPPSRRVPWRSGRPTGQLVRRGCVPRGAGSQGVRRRARRPFELPAHTADARLDAVDGPSRGYSPALPRHSGLGTAIGAAFATP